MDMQRKRLELNTKQSIAAIGISLVVVYFAASWAIDSGKLVPHVIAYLSAYYGIYFLVELIKKRMTNDKTSTARRAKKAH